MPVQVVENPKRMLDDGCEGFGRNLAEFPSYYDSQHSHISLPMP
jgi:hypothetical protein